jgi:hypothetical protein
VTTITTVNANAGNTTAEWGRSGGKHIDKIAAETTNGAIEVASIDGFELTTFKPM